MSRNQVVVAIHGVGNAKPNEIASALAGLLGFRSTRQTTAYSEGSSFVELQDEESGNSIVEVNWADLLKSHSTILGVLRHICFIVTSMLDVASSGSVLIRYYRLVLLTITPGAVLFTVATAIGVSVSTDWYRSLLLFLLLLASLIVFWWLLQLGKHFRFFGLWIGLVAVTWFVATPKQLTSYHPLMALSAIGRAGGFLLVLALLLAGMIGTVCRKGKTIDEKLASLALLYLQTT